ncbi:MAG: DUF1569 domain-containing protein [Acidobacteria bacterium]|nr:DUF1569 domain-containing protein [Acidobacteriota bacterium]
MEGKNFYDRETYDALLGRVERLTRDAEPGWGRMNSSQMLAHCAEVAEVAAGKPLVGTPWFVRLMGGLIKRMVVSDKPYPRDSRTHPQYVMTESVDFEQQKERLLAVLGKLKENGPEGAEQMRHELFGKLKAEEAGWVAYKHLDHHLAQFGV